MEWERSSISRRLIAAGWRIELAILLLAITIRGIHLLGLMGNPLFDEPRMDPRYHDDWARSIVAGEVVADRPFFRAPFYPYFLATIYALSGGSILAARSVQLLLGALVPLLVIRIGRLTLGRGVALAAGLLAALYPLALRFEGDLLLEGPFVVLAMAALWFQLRTLSRPSVRGWIGTGLLFRSSP